MPACAATIVCGEATLSELTAPALCTIQGPGWLDLSEKWDYSTVHVQVVRSWHRSPTRIPPTTACTRSRVTSGSVASCAGCAPLGPKRQAGAGGRLWVRYVTRVLDCTRVDPTDCGGRTSRAVQDPQATHRPPGAASVHQQSCGSCARGQITGVPRETEPMQQSPCPPPRSLAAACTPWSHCRNCRTTGAPGCRLPAMRSPPSSLFARTRHCAAHALGEGTHVYSVGRLNYSKVEQ